MGGITQYCIVLHGIAWYCMVVHGIAWYCMVLHGIAQYCMVLYGIAWYCMALHDLALSCTLLHYLALSCTILHYLAISCTILHLRYTCSQQMRPVIAFDIAVAAQKAKVQCCYIMAEMLNLTELKKGGLVWVAKLAKVLLTSCCCSVTKWSNSIEGHENCNFEAPQ